MLTNPSSLSVCCTCLDTRANHTLLFSSSSSFSFRHFSHIFILFPLPLSYLLSLSTPHSCSHSYLQFHWLAMCNVSFFFSPSPPPPPLCVLFIFSLFLFQCEAVLWSFAVDQEGSKWRRMRLPLLPQLFCPSQHITFRLFWIVGVFWFFLNLIFVFFNEINVQHSCA